MVSEKDRNRAYEILSEYKGLNYYILTLRRNVYVLKQTVLNDFECEYIVRNYDKEIAQINKVVKIANWYGEKLKKEKELSFTPEKINIISIIGETEKIFHCNVQYKQNMNSEIMFIPKNAILTNLFAEDYNKLSLDFSWFDKKLKEKDPDYFIYDHQKEAVKFLLTRKKCILSLDMGLGKMEPISSILPTPNGFKKMGDIVPGDKIFGSDGKEHNVLQIFPHKDKEIYKVNFSDGTSAECGLDHLWIVRDSYNRKQGKWQTLSLRELLDRGLTYNDQKRINSGLNPRSKYEIPVSLPVEYSKKDYLINPYVLGMCIGDGNLCSGRIGISIPDIEKESVYRIKERLHEYMNISEDRSASCPRYYLIYNKKGVENPYIQEINRLGLNVHGNYKFIPEEYKLGSIEQRIELLKGLMDSDGTITKTNNHISYSTNSERLANDIAELVNSLGGIARIHCYDRKKEGKNVEYTVLIQIKFNPFYLNRKAERYNPTFKKYCHRYITSAEYVRNEDAQCIMVDSADHSYLTGRSYIVTHNTFSSIIASLMYGTKKVLVICPASIKDQWKDELSVFVDEDNINIIKGFDEMNKEELMEFLGITDKKAYKVAELREMAKERGKWNEGKQFTIVNFDIIDEFHTISRAKNNKESELLKSDFDVVIIDEAHKLSNNKSGRFKTIKNYLKHANNEYTWLLTGTMVTNDVKNLYNLLSLIEDDVTGDYNYFMEHYCGAEKILLKGEWDRCWRIWSKGGKFSYSSLDKKSKDSFKAFVGKVGKHTIKASDNINLDELNERINHLYFRRMKDDVMSVEKIIVPVTYNLTIDQKHEYDNLWEEYEKEKLAEGKDLSEVKQLVSVFVNRKYISNLMVPNTINLAEKLISNGKKVFIVCCYDEELYSLKDYFGEKAVIYNGKMDSAQKAKAKDEFNNNPDIKVLIGNITAVGIGLNLNKSCNHCIFQDMDFTDAGFQQACDRIYRIGTKENCYIYLQYYKNTVYEHIVDIISRKREISNQVINDK